MALNNAQERYTDSRRTRVYQREQEQFIGQTQAIAPKEKLLEGLSIPQVIAGAAAAATSVALASHIGIAGSVIGAAVSSIVTVLSSQVYRHFLSAGAAKLKHEPERPGPSSAYVSGYGYSERAAQGYYDRQPARYGARIAPPKLQARAAAERAATQRKVIGFSVLAGALAVVVCAGAIWLFTAGQGLGQRIDTLWPAANEQPEDTTTRNSAQASASDSNKDADASDSAPSSTDTSGKTDDTSASSGGTSGDAAQSGTSSDSSTSGGMGAQDTSSSQGKTDGTGDTQNDSNNSATQSATAA